MENVKHSLSSSLPLAYGTRSRRSPTFVLFRGFVHVPRAAVCSFLMKRPIFIFKMPSTLKLNFAKCQCPVCNFLTGIIRHRIPLILKWKFLTFSWVFTVSCDCGAWCHFPCVGKLPEMSWALRDKVLTIHWVTRLLSGPLLHKARAAPVLSCFHSVIHVGWVSSGDQPSASTLKSPVHKQSWCVIPEGISCWKDRHKTGCWKETGTLPAVV